MAAATDGGEVLVYEYRGRLASGGTFGSDVSNVEQWKLLTKLRGHTDGRAFGRHLITVVFLNLFSVKTGSFELKLSR